MLHKELTTHFRDHITNPDLRVHEKEQFRQAFPYESSVFQERMDIYRNNVFTSLSNVILSRHKLLKALVGEDFLDMIARRYVRENLPDQACLDYYALDFAAFLKNQKEVKAYPYLSDVATLETKAHLVAHADDDTALDVTKIQSLPAEKLDTLRLKTRAAFDLFKSDWPIYSIRDFCLKEIGIDQTQDIFEDTDLGANAALDPTDQHKNVTKQDKVSKDRQETLDISTGGENVFIIRSFLKTDIHVCNDAEYLFLENIKNNTALNDATEHVLSKHPDFDLGITLQKHFKLGTFKSYEIEEI